MKTIVLALLILASAFADHGPTMPPNPWDGITTADSGHGPTMPPNPWDGIALSA